MAMLSPAFLFTSWLPFALLLPWARRGSGLRAAWLPVAAGVLATAYTLITLRLWPQANIRVDLLGVEAALFVCDLVGAVAVGWVVLADRRAPRLSAGARPVARVAALAAGAWLLVAGVGYAVSQFETARMTRRFTSGQKLLLAAELRDRDSAAIAYGALSTDEPRLAPFLGVWDLQSPAEGVRTVVIAADGRVWLRYECAVQECEAGPGELRPGAAGQAQATVPSLGRWRVWELGLVPLGDQSLRVSVAPRVPRAGHGPRTEPAHRRLLAVAARPVARDLVPLGTFSALEWMPQHVALTEVRLWRQGRTIHGLGLCDVKVPASPTMLMPKRFETPMEAGGTFALPLERCRGTLRPVAGGLELSGEDPRDWRVQRTVLLAPVARVADPALDLAPNGDLAAWREWMESVVPPVVQWKAPARPAATVEAATVPAKR